MRHDQFRIGWICALAHELAASRAMLDEEYPDCPPKALDDSNVYTAGRIGSHNVILACLPAGNYGNESAARVATDLARSFPSISYALLVGIGGGIPTTENDIRLGDVVVSKPGHAHGGVVQYDLGKTMPDGSFEQRGYLNKPPAILLNAVQNLQATYQIRGSTISSHLDCMFDRYPSMRKTYSRPPVPTAVLSADIPNVIRTARLTDDGLDDISPFVHHGLVGSGNRVIANAEERDKLRAADDILCLEMEAAGMMDVIPCLVIRGVCDYAEGHKDDVWQHYAAAAAAAYAKELLLTLPAINTHVAPEDHTARYKLPFSFNGIRAVKTFVGRHEHLQKMESVLEPTTIASQRKVYIVRGMGGVGKTQLCLHYARKYHEHYTAVLWINGATETDVKRSFLDYARRIPEASPTSRAAEPEAARSVLDWLAKADNRNWLMIFDNVDLDADAESPDPEAYFLEDDYFPDADHGTILVTTRLDTLRDLGHDSHLQEMGEDESLQILESRVGRRLIDDADAAETLRQLQGLPLALALAAAYVRDTGRSFADYNQLYKEQWTYLFERQDRRPLREYGARRLLTTWAMSLERVRQENEDATRLLEFWSFFDSSWPSGTLLSLLNDRAHPGVDIKKWPSWLARLGSDKLAFADAVSPLLRYSLVSQVGVARYPVHPLVHEWTFQSMLARNKGESQELCSIACSLISEAIPDLQQFDETEYLAIHWILAPHAASVVRRMDQCFLPEEEELVLKVIPAEASSSIALNLTEAFVCNNIAPEAEWMMEGVLKDQGNVQAAAKMLRRVAHPRLDAQDRATWMLGKGMLQDVLPNLKVDFISEGPFDHFDGFNVVPAIPLRASAHARAKLGLRDARRMAKRAIQTHTQHFGHASLILLKPLFQLARIGAIGHDWDEIDKVEAQVKAICRASGNRSPTVLVQRLREQLRLYVVPESHPGKTHQQGSTRHAAVTCEVE